MILGITIMVIGMVTKSIIIKWDSDMYIYIYVKGIPRSWIVITPNMWGVLRSWGSPF